MNKLGLAIALSLTMTSHAGTLGFNVGANLWQQSYQSTIQSRFAGSGIDLENAPLQRSITFDNATHTNALTLHNHLSTQLSTTFTETPPSHMKKTIST